MLTKDCEKNVDAEVGIASTLEEYTKRRQDDSQDNLANVTRGRVLVNPHCRLVFSAAGGISQKLQACRNSLIEASGKPGAKWTVLT